MIKFPNEFLKGTVEITDNLRYIKEIIYHQPQDLRVVVLSEDNDLSPNHPNVIKASNLLPPIEAQIAEVDGLAEKYYSIYGTHLVDPFNTEFISALLTFIHRGGSLIFYVKDMSLFFVKAFSELMRDIYGIAIPMSGFNVPSNMMYDYSHITQWLVSMYQYNTIDAVEFCVFYPLEMQIPPDVEEKLVYDFGIYADTLADAILQFRDFQAKIKKNPLVQNALVTTEYDHRNHFKMIH